jgi:hypothetical protein
MMAAAAAAAVAATAALDGLSLRHARDDEGARAKALAATAAARRRAGTTRNGSLATDVRRPGKSNLVISRDDVAVESRAAALLRGRDSTTRTAPEVENE